MAAPLLGLASLLGREYAYTRPTFKEQDDLLKILSPQTYYGNQLINYLTDKFGVRSSLPSAQNTIENAARTLYGSQYPQGIDLNEEERLMEEIQARTNSPEGRVKFEDTLRNETYGTINPASSYYVGPDAEDSERFKFNETMLPRRLESVPVESNFTPAQLDALRERIYGITPEVGPQQELVFPSGPGGGYMPQGGAGGDFMPQDSGYGKNNFDVEEYEQYLRGGLIQRRR
jgi:hypothetical protein